MLRGQELLQEWHDLGQESVAVIPASRERRYGVVR